MTCFVSLVEFGCSCWFCEILEVRVHLLGPCGRSGEVRSRHAITLWSRVTGWQRAGVGTLSDLFRLLVRSWVFLLVVCDSRSPCACFKPMWSVRRGQGPTCYHFMEPSHRMGEGPRWARFLTFFASLVEFVCSGWLYFIVEVRVHVLSPCGRSGDVRGRRSITF